MINLKKPIIFAFLLAVLVSPLISSVRANNGQWGSAVASAAWNYDLYRVERLAFGSNVQGPFEFNDGVFVSEPAKSCVDLSTCKAVDMTILKDGKGLKTAEVQSNINSAFWHSAQDGRFVYTVMSVDKASWGTVYEYDSKTGIVKTLNTIDRKANDLNYLSSVVDKTRVYSSILNTNKDTSQIEMKLFVTDTETDYQRDDFTWTLNASWQEILDVQNDVVLVKLGFDGGFTQLVLMNEKARTVKEIPGTWTEPNGSLIAAHLLSDGTVQYFQNYRLYTYKPGQEKAQESGGAYLNWFVSPEKAVQFVGDRMAYVDAENTLYVTSAAGAANFGTVFNGKFTLEADAIYYESPKGSISYTFSTQTWNTRHFFVTDTYQDIMVGVDAQGNVWYENQTTGKMISFGRGSNPVLSDREHAVWRGVDDNIYQASFSSLLDLGNASVEAVKSYDSNTVYLKSGNKMWKVTDETTYFTWFASWSNVTSVSPATLQAYLNDSTYLGMASFAPGTRVKAVGNPRVYVAGMDGQLHWIVSETVANSIYGSKWNKQIIEVQPVRLWNYAIGVQINSNKDIQVI